MTGEDATSDRDGHGMGDQRSEEGGPFGDRPACPGRVYHGVSGGKPVRGDGGGSRPASADGHRTSGGAQSSYEEKAGHESGSEAVQDSGDGTAHDESAYDDSPLAAMLGAAIRGERPDGEAERRVLGAFRAARDAGAHRARTRRRDDWRPRGRRWGGRSLKATGSLLLASLTLGGVAYAAIGTGDGGPAKGAVGAEPVRPGVTTASVPAAGSHSKGEATASVPAERPATAKDTLAHCRAYEKLVGRGGALDSTALQRLAAAAGGTAKVSAYCAARAGADTAGEGVKPGKRKGVGKTKGKAVGR
ncbi:hypothetical protein [Streptomyces sp. SID13726]|uniref:hypothetical protein n=1 Tax=Streptomyces sp. SID13726 TaxID=2706058 RepID=UPI0013BE46AE|nr:hypothetical protein [Streptomyces sp. SID13726]NEA99785.1 hypothetical protein [Streptomyces sp. SID13726]